MPYKFIGSMIVGLSLMVSGLEAAPLAKTQRVLGTIKLPPKAAVSACPFVGTPDLLSEAGYTARYAGITSAGSVLSNNPKLNESAGNDEKNAGVEINVANLSDIHSMSFNFKAAGVEKPVAIVRYLDSHTGKSWMETVTMTPNTQGIFEANWDEAKMADFFAKIPPFENDNHHEPRMFVEMCGTNGSNQVADQKFVIFMYDQYYGSSDTKPSLKFEIPSGRDFDAN